ncbi:MAG: methionine--tRNA ligase [Acidobacteriota bacterium]|nr:methionine--tRNA ligase [Acidobacteriota bacterium]MDE3108077.1 methionine--tRNA ligase [Acidobacteriota bacterium]
MGRFYVTTPIYYVNDAPHVGSAYCTVNADALARWHRLAGDEVKFLTGTDEHGQKIADTAASHGVTPQAWVDQIAPRFLEAWRDLNISNDDFIRTTEPRHFRTVQAFLTKIYENGSIYKDVYEGLYCVSCEDYYTLEASDEGKCPIHGRPLTEMQEENWFFRLSAFQDRLLAFYEEHPNFVTPETRRNEALSFIKGGLKDISITRTSISWGIPVPWDERHVFYVWYDALINYLTAIGYGREDDEVEKWWPNSHHLVGKEIIRFHCVWWPAMCLAAGLEPVSHVQVTGWLLVGGKKLGKTMDADAPVKLTDIVPSTLSAEFGVDPLRYYLLRETILGNDGEFSIESITARYNTDLANNLGNLVARVVAVVTAKCAGVGPAPSVNSTLRASAERALGEARLAWERFAPSLALEATWELIGATNAYLEEHAPWKMDAGDAVSSVLGDALEAIRLVAILITPAMPSVAEEIWRRIGLVGSPAEGPFDEVARWGRYPGGQHVVKADPLFPRIVEVP